MLLTILFSFLTVLVYASPIMLLTKREVYDPPVTNPNSQTVWQAGSTETVTWDTSSLPGNLSNTGMVVLGFLSNGSENLMLDTPLAQNFLLTSGSVSITVPNVPTMSNYIIALFGDSGNISPEFTIMGGSSSPNTTSTSTVVLSTSGVTTPTITSSSIPTDSSSTTATPAKQNVRTGSTAATSTPSQSFTSAAQKMNINQHYILGVGMLFMIMIL